MGCKHVVGACERLRSRAEVVEGLVGVTFEGLYTNSAAFCLACGGADEMVGKRGAREQLVHLIQRRSVSTSMVEHASASASVSCVCLLLQDLLQSCSRGGGGIVEDMCYERRRLRAEACVESVCVYYCSTY